jgi:hypothetical protein
MDDKDTKKMLELLDKVVVNTGWICIFLSIGLMLAIASILALHR